jgi:response regulator RpfG family c-di-GMP phosphodiesterase
VTLLGHRGHQLLEAADGFAALKICQAERPDLVISDILMPTMDGFEFVRLLRDDPTLANTAVIFYTATYYQPEAQSLARACGVLHLLQKPSSPEVILRTVNAALGLAPVAAQPPTAEGFRRGHLALLTDTLTHKVNELQAVNLRLGALIDLGRELTLQHETRRLLEKFAAAGRRIIAARFAAVGILAEGGRTLSHFVSDGLDAEAAARIGVPSPRGGLLARLLHEGAPLRLRNPSTDPQAIGLPPHHPAMRSFLGTVIATASRTYGLLYLADKVGTEGFSEADEQVVVTLAAQLAVSYENAELVGKLRQANAELTLAYEATLEGWVRALDLRDKETEGHTQRVTEMTLRLARELGWSNGEAVHLRRGALLHDIGKIGVPDRILLKPGPLTEDEWEVMRRHPVYAYRMLSPITYLGKALDIPYSHHERWDGGGYPRGLKGEQIPLAARLFAVADVWDALSFDRPYRSAWPRERVRLYLREQAGKHFDPQVVETFLRLEEAVREQGGIQSVFP